MGAGNWSIGVHRMRIPLYTVGSVLSALLLTSCATWMDERAPNLIETTSEPVLDDAPRIKLVWRHGARRGRRPSGADWEDRTSKEGARFGRAITEALATSGSLANAGVSPSDQVHYVLILDSDYVASGVPWMWVSFGLTGWILPAAVVSDYTITGALYEAASGDLVVLHEAYATTESLYWLPVLLVMPVTVFTDPSSSEIYGDTVRDLFIQLGQTLEGRPLPEAVEASRVVPQELPPHISRSIDVRPVEPSTP